MPGSAEDAMVLLAHSTRTPQSPLIPVRVQPKKTRVKPNVAYVGSDVMSVAHNTGDGYTAFSGTSMATPGAAGVAALMLQANPALSPFEVRNFMQETAEYRCLCIHGRSCWY